MIVSLEYLIRFLKIQVTSYQITKINFNDKSMQVCIMCINDDVIKIGQRALNEFYNVNNHVQILLHCF